MLERKVTMFELKPVRRNRNNVSEYNPFRDWEDFERNFLGNPFGFFDRNMFSDFKTDIKDEGNSYLLEADLPGFDKKDININIDGETLTISAERHSEHEEKDKQDKYVRCERSYGSYSRSFDISAIDEDEIKAKYENGVLKLTLPKKEVTQPETKRLEID